MKYFAVLFFVGLATAAINDDFLNEHAHQFLSTRGTVTDKDDAFDNLDKVELVRTFSFCMRNYKMVGLDSTAQCLAKSWRNSKAAPLLMKDFLKRVEGQAAGKDVSFEVTIDEFDSILHSAGKDITWTALGAVTVVGGKSTPYHRKGQLHLGKGSVTYADDITSSGTDYDFEATTGVHVDFSSTKSSEGVVFIEAVISASQAAGLKVQQENGSTLEAEHVGQATIHAHGQALKNDDNVQVSVSATVSTTNQDSVHVHKSDGSITHVHSFGTDGSNVIEAINVTLGATTAKVSATGVFEGRGANAADEPDYNYRYTSEGAVKKTVHVSLDSENTTIVAHDEISAYVDVSDYDDKALASVSSESVVDNTVTVTVDFENKSLSAKGNGKFSGKVSVSTSAGDADTSEDGTFSGSLNATDNGDDTATVHADGDLKVNIHYQ